MANTTFLQLVVIAVLLACCTEHSVGLPLGKREDKERMFPENVTSDNATSTLTVSGKAALPEILIMLQSGPITRLPFSTRLIYTQTHMVVL